jgi:NAD(P)-dependent dehydrogenase (short-subunit alcohol dehydrogenase family)
MLNGKIALVTGGGSGIGKAIALKLGQNGAKVAIVSRSLGKLEQATADLKGAGVDVLPIAMDVRKKDDVEHGVETLVSAWGAVHILVNNAGISGLSMLSDPDDARWYDIIDTNLHGLYLVTKAVLKSMPACPDIRRTVPPSTA